MTGTSPRRVVYTALFGNYEALMEQPIARTSNADFLCFTDDSRLVSDTWKIIQVKSSTPWDPTRSARRAKILVPDLVLQGYDESLWIDNRVLLNRDPATYLDECLVEDDLALSYHSYRRTVLDEYRAVMRAGIDSRSRIREQLHIVSARYAIYLSERPLWTGILARRHSQAVLDAMAIWWEWVAMFSRRDQLSINIALGESELKVAKCWFDNFNSVWHEWINVQKNPSIQFASSPFRYSLVQDVGDRLATRPEMLRLRRKLDALLNS